MLSEYSEAELKLIKTIFPGWFSVIKRSSINPPDLFKIMGQEAFIKNLQGEPVEALRKVCAACSLSKPYRKTVEFDALCQFDDSPITEGGKESVGKINHDNVI